MTIHTDSPAGDLSRLRIDRDTGGRRRWVPWARPPRAGGRRGGPYPNARAYVAERRAPEVETARVTQVVTTPGGSTALPVLVASGYVVARRSSDVGVKIGGRLARLRFEEGTRVRKGEVIARDRARGSRRAARGVAPRRRGSARRSSRQAIAARDEDRPQPRAAARADEGRHHHRRATLTAAESAAAVSAARVKSAEAAIAQRARPRARHRGGDREHERAGAVRRRGDQEARGGRRNRLAVRRHRARPRARAAPSPPSPTSPSSRCRPRSARTASRS